MEDSKISENDTKSAKTVHEAASLSLDIMADLEQDLDDENGYEEEFVSDAPGEIKRFLEEAGGNITVGPSYTTHSMKGEQVNMSTAYRTVSIKGTPILKILFTATDHEGNLIGQRTTFLEDKGSYFWGTGNVNIVKRNVGVLIPVELANVDFLTRYAQEKGKNIEYNVINSNNNYLKKKKEEYSELVGKVDDSVESHRRMQYLEKEIARTEEEQVRWLKVWGPNGKLGYDADGVKIYDKAFDPRDETQGLETIDRIEFKREDVNGVASVRVQSVTEISEDVNKRNTREIQRLKWIVSMV